jgi:cell division protein FtsL
MKKKKKSKLGFVVLLLFSIYFVYVFAEQQHMLYVKNIEMRNVEAKVKEEQATNDKLIKQKDMISSDEYIEKIAREKLGMVKPGEKVFVDVNK